MNRSGKILVALTLVGIPALAHTYYMAPQGPCFTAGAITYRVTDGTAADYRVSFEAGTVKPDVRIALVDRAETADFVLVDDVHAPAGHACKGATQLRTVAIAPAGRSSDLSIGLVAQDAAADYKLYVHSARFSPQDAAALFAVISKGRTRRDLAGR